MISSALIFREHLRITQILGIVVLIIGLALFFNTNLIELVSNLSSYSLGVWFGVAAAISWTIYAVAQKAILTRFAAEQLLWLIYILCSVMLLPYVQPAAIKQLSWIAVLVVLYCGLNTIIGYGCLVAAMEHWQASQVSAITTLTPLFTLLFSDLIALLFPETFTMMSLNLLGYLGAFMVVAGAMFATIGHYIWHPRKGILTEYKSREKE